MPVNDGFPEGFSVVSFLDAGDVILAGTNGDGIYAHSTTSSAWLPYNEGLPPGSHVMDMQRNSNTTFIIASSPEGSGLYYRPSGYPSWLKISGDLPVEDLQSVQFFGDWIFVGTMANSIFRASVIPISSVAEGAYRPEHTAYPVPASSTVTVNGFTDATTITAWSIHGVAVRLTGEPTPNGVRLDISGLAPGIWMVRGTTTGGTAATTRLIVE